MDGSIRTDHRPASTPHRQFALEQTFPRDLHWPESHRAIERWFEGVSEQVAGEVLVDNAAKLYNCLNRIIYSSDISCSPAPHPAIRAPSLP